MLTAQTSDLLSRLRVGVFELSDLEILEQSSIHAFRSELDADFPLQFQERQFNGKWEFGMAHSLRFELASLGSKRSVFPIVYLAPVFKRCVFLNGDGDAITGISLVNRLRVRPIRKPVRGSALTMGRGFKLDHMLDGWALKPLQKRTVKLDDDFLRKRGWRFDAIEQFAPKP